MKKPRELWIDPDYDGYFDDTDENLLASGFVKYVEKATVMKHIEMLVKALEKYESVSGFESTELEFAAHKALVAHKEWLEGLK